MPRDQVLRKERGENTKEHAVHSQETTKVGRIQPVRKEVIRRKQPRQVVLIAIRLTTNQARLDARPLFRHRLPTTTGERLALRFCICERPFEPDADNAAAGSHS